MWQITVMSWVFKTFKYLKEKVTRSKPEGVLYSKGHMIFRGNQVYIANENIPEDTPFEEGTTGPTWALVTVSTDTDTDTTWPIMDNKSDSTTSTKPEKDEPYPGFDAKGKMIFDDGPKANKKYSVDRDLESMKHLMRMQKMVAKSIKGDEITLKTLKREIQILYLICKPDVDTLPVQMAFITLNVLRDKQRAVKKRLANNASTAYWLKQQLK